MNDRVGAEVTVGAAQANVSMSNTVSLWVITLRPAHGTALATEVDWARAPTAANSRRNSECIASKHEDATLEVGRKTEQCQVV